MEKMGATSIAEVVRAMLAGKASLARRRCAGSRAPPRGSRAPSPH